jgi:hypothetical protein
MKKIIQLRNQNFDLVLEKCFTLENYETRVPILKLFEYKGT